MAHDYDDWYFKGLYPEYWERRVLRFDDSFCGLAYAFGIERKTLVDYFPEISISSNHVTKALKHSYSVDDQIEFIQKHTNRNPKNVLEIGAGRGEVSATIAKLGSNVTSVDISPVADVWFKKTGELFFGTKFIMPTLHQMHIKDFKFDASDFDTILMIESFEHIKEDEFFPVWENIVKNFHGLLIIVNFMEYHPIPIMGEEHCREVNDLLFDDMSYQAKSVVFRQGSHLVLEF